MNETLRDAAKNGNIVAMRAAVSQGADILDTDGGVRALFVLGLGAEGR